VIVMQLSNRTIFVDDIVSIYEEHKCGEFQNYTNYYIETKNGQISVNKSDYNKVQYYLLSLNEPIYEELPKEDKKIKPLNIAEIVDDELQGLVKSINLCNKEIQDKINEIIDKANGGE